MTCFQAGGMKRRQTGNATKKSFPNIRKCGRNTGNKGKKFEIDEAGIQAGDSESIYAFLRVGAVFSSLRTPPTNLHPPIYARATGCIIVSPTLGPNSPLWVTRCGSNHFFAAGFRDV
jgi:hypothetical protein